MDKKTIRDIEVAGKTVLVRVDFNVPRSKETGEITNDNRIVAALPTIKYLLEQSPKAIVLFSHLGKVKTEEDKAKNNLAVVAPRLAELLGRDVKFVDCTRGAELEEAVKNAENGQVILVQNTRYEAGESKNDPELGKYWASLGDVFVEDAFGSVQLHNERHTDRFFIYFSADNVPVYFAYSFGRRYRKGEFRNVGNFILYHVRFARYTDIRYPRVRKSSRRPRKAHKNRTGTYNNKPYHLGYNLRCIFYTALYR